MTPDRYVPKTGDVVIYRGRSCRVGHVFASTAAPASGWLVELEPHSGIGLMHSGVYLGYVDAAVLERDAEGSASPKIVEEV
jgi:hypothetical protein